jgi:hypothetical protein
VDLAALAAMAALTAFTTLAAFFSSFLFIAEERHELAVKRQFRTER